MAVPWRSPKFHVILSSTLMGIMGVALLGPVLPTLKDVFAISDARVGLVLTAYTLPGIVLAPFVGLIADRIGRKRVLVPLLVLYGLAGMGSATAQTFDQLLAFRLLQGIGASSLITLAVTLIGDYYEGIRRDEIVSMNSSAIGIGAAIFPTLGGALVVVHWTAPFVFFGVAILVALLAVLVIDEPSTSRATALPAYLRQLGSVLRNRKVLGMYGAALVTYVLFYGGVLTAIPLVLDETYGLSAPRIGVLLAAASVASAAVASQNSRLGTRFSVSTLLGTGFLAFGVAFLGISQTDSVPVIGSMLFLFGSGLGLMAPSIDRTLVGAVSSAQRASVMGMTSSMIWLGQTIGPALFPLLATDIFAQSGGYSYLFLVFGSTTILGGVVTITIHHVNLP